MTVRGHVLAIMGSLLNINILSLRVWDSSTGQEVRTLEGHSDLVRIVALSSDEKTIASGSNDRTVRCVMHQHCMHGCHRSSHFCPCSLM